MKKIIELLFGNTFRTVIISALLGVLLLISNLWSIFDPITSTITIALALGGWLQAKKLEKSLDASMMNQKTFQITFGLRAGYEGENADFLVEHATDVVVDWQQARVSANLPIITGYTTEITMVYPVRNGETENRITKEKSGMFAGSLSPKYDIGRSDEEVIDTLSSLASHIGLCLKQKRVYLSYHGKQWAIDTESEWG